MVLATTQSIYFGPALLLCKHFILQLPRYEDALMHKKSVNHISLYFVQCRCRSYVGPLTCSSTVQDTFQPIPVTTDEISCTKLCPGTMCDVV